MTFPDHLQRLGAELDLAWDRRYGARARQARTIRAALVFAVAAALLAAVLARSSGPGAVEKALAAAGQAPAGAIVHFTSATRGSDGTVLERTELWGATSPPFARRSILEGEGAAAIEQGAQGNELTQFDPAGVVYVRTVTGGVAEATRPPDFATSAEGVKEYLREGKAREIGELTVGGTTVRRFVVAPPGGGTCTYDVQPSTYYGVSLACSGTPGGDTLEHWEYLPRQGNERLLSVVAQHPSAKVNRAPIAQCGAGRHTASTPPCVVSSPGA